MGSTDPIGDIVDRNGVASLIRESGEKLSVSDNNIPDIKLLDTAVTGNGRMLIQFLDVFATPNDSGLITLWRITLAPFLSLVQLINFEVKFCP